MPSPKVKQAIAAFEKAVTDRAVAETTERELIGNRELIAIEHNYAKARAKLERLLENA